MKSTSVLGTASCPVDTTDLERAHAVIRDTYKVGTMTAETRGPRGFRFRQSVVGDHRFGLGRFSYTGTVESESEIVPFVCVGQVHSGRLEVTNESVQLRTVPRTPFLFPDGVPVRTRYDDLDLGQVMLDRSALEEELRALRLLPAGGVRFFDPSPVSADAVRHWQALSSHVYREVLGNEAAASSELVRGSVFRMFVAALLETFPSNVVDDHLEHDPAPLPGTVRRALAFIEERSGGDIGLVEIAQAARLTPRGLQLAFRRHLDATPLAALRAERLRRAHADLVEASPDRGDTVAAIAARWGFAHQGRFAAAYQASYGRPPRTTLER
ncbi:AraC family transcriptional regulator [Frigoribacterium salinisoli]